MRFKYFCENGLVSTEEKVSTGMGTIWHRLREEYNVVCAETERPDNIFEWANNKIWGIVEKLPIPSNCTPEEWAADCNIVLCCFYVFIKTRCNAVEKTLAEELSFYEVPISPGISLKGKIDRIISDEVGDIYIHEYKSTTKDINSSQYWDDIYESIQHYVYLYAVTELQKSGDLEEFGVDKPVTGVAYSVVRWPGIRPKFLTQAASKEFVESGIYYGTKFDVLESEGGTKFTVNGVDSIITPGKRDGTFAVYETMAMFRTRVLDELMNNPNNYFVERFIPITDSDFEKVLADIRNTTRAIQGFIKAKCWYKDRSRCRVPFRCAYYSFCFNSMIDIEGGQVPAGFRCIYDKEDSND
jgi:hypothetical protein